ncbi:hypothetical protein [Streptomyces canus]|uniref:hypothetical protein n=1 Tax=Streptomyces canus TaxID=58343 RepID=UPI000365640B|nr:hypothetical protein [Streptomyces canus]
MVADGLLSQAELPGDLVIAVPARNPVQYLQLPFCEFGKGLGGVTLVRSGEKGHDAASDDLAIDSVARGDGEDGEDGAQDLGAVDTLRR